MPGEFAGCQLPAPATKPGVEALAVLLVVLTLRLDDPGAVPEVRDCQCRTRGAPWGLRRCMVQQPAMMPAHISQLHSPCQSLKSISSPLQVYGPRGFSLADAAHSMQMTAKPGLTYGNNLVATGAEVTAAGRVMEVRGNVSVGALGKLQTRVGLALQAGRAASCCSPCRQLPIPGTTALLEDTDTSMLLPTRELHHLGVCWEGCPKGAGEACLKRPQWDPCSHKAAGVQGRKRTVAMPAHHRPHIPSMQVRMQPESKSGSATCCM